MEVQEKPKSCNMKRGNSPKRDFPAILKVSKKEEPIENGTEGGDNVVAVDYLDSFPPGYRFCPLDEELVLCYLEKKVMGLPLPYNRITEVNLYSYNPERLAELYEQYGEREWYFFTPREKKYPNGSRPNRSAGDGYWKATGADREIKVEGCVVGYRKALVFYKGKAPKGDKTSWIMHEFRVHDPPLPKKDKGHNEMRLDDYVLCRIYKKADTKLATTEFKIEDPSLLIRNEDTEILASDDMMNSSMIENSTNQMFNEELFVRQMLSEESLNHSQQKFNQDISTNYIYDGFEQDDLLNSSGNFVDYSLPLDLLSCINVESREFKEEESMKEYQRQFYEIQK